MKTPLDGRVAIVTGAGGGLGREHALYLARQGARVVVNDLAPTAVDAVAGEILARGGVALPVAASVTDESAVAAMVSRVLAQWSRIDILVNNAGILRDKSFAKMSLDDFRLVVDVHLMGSVICTKAVWDTMRAQRYGRIVMTTSSSGLFGNFGQANYGAAKMALVGLMQTLAIEGGKYGITVNCLAPSAATQMTQGVLSARSRSRRAHAGVLRIHAVWAVACRRHRSEADRRQSQDGLTARLFAMPAVQATRLASFRPA
jgi:NAD(P)-dependent dehydrogenase (short-subunit alcohol dehydrogenase family)